MEILEFKNSASSADKQNLIIGEGEKGEFLIPITPQAPLIRGGNQISLDPSLPKRKFTIDFEIRENASVRVFVIGVLSVGEVNICLNSSNIGANSSFDAKVGFVQFGDSALDFQGLMRIENGAKNASANLQAKSLLLSKDASANLVPSLEILENEVSAGHGAVVKSIDPEEIFYLRSRGISLEKVNELLIAGFLNSFGVELPKEISDKFDLVIKRELFKRCNS